VLLAATTGMRRGELVELQWSNVDLDAGALRVTHGKTPHAQRTISLPPSTATALRRHRKEQTEHASCAGRRGRKMTSWWMGDGASVNPDSVSHGFAEVAESVGLADVRLHDLRHGFASALLETGE